MDNRGGSVGSGGKEVISYGKLVWIYSAGMVQGYYIYSGFVIICASKWRWYVWWAAEVTAKCGSPAVVGMCAWGQVNIVIGRYIC